MTRPPAGLLVVGAGLAAVQLVASLREAGWSAAITVVGAEDHAPYQRPPLSKGFLAGSVAEVQLAHRTPDFFRGHGVELVLGDSVEDLGLGSGGRGVARCGSGGRLAYDRLVLATGAAPRRLPIAAGVGGVHHLRGLDDAVALRAALRGARSLVVLGAGFVGLEVAATGHALGCEVTVVEAGPQVLGRAVGSVTAAHVAARHRAAGIDLRTGVVATGLRTSRGWVSAVELDDGSVHPADLVLVAVGAAPRDELARSAGLRCEGGVVVDAGCLASDGITVAIGDCAVGPDRTPGGDPTRLLRLESVDNATQQAAAAAATLLGSAPPPVAVPWFWSDQGDLKLQIAGVARTGDACVVRRGEDPRRLVCVYYRDGRAVAAEAVGSPADFVALRKALAGGSRLDPADVADTATSLRSLVDTAVPSR